VYQTHKRQRFRPPEKKKNGCKDDQRALIISKLFGTTGLSSALDTVEFDVKAREISRDHPEFDPYFQTHLKDRLREYVNIPKRQLRHDRLWTNNNCESMNHHVFKRAVNSRADTKSPRHCESTVN
jgi:hypothetical protein